MVKSWSYSMKNYNILLLGEDITTHAIASKIEESKRANKIYTETKFYNVNSIVIPKYSTIKEIISYVKNNNISLVISDSKYNSFGIIDSCNFHGIKAIGVNYNWSKLEGSKLLSKKFMKKYLIDTPDYIEFKDLQELLDRIDNNLPYPIVLKLDGYSKGIGVFICYNKNELLESVSLIDNLKLNADNSKIILEEFIDGDEFVVVSLWDGKNLRPMLPIKDYKRLSDKKTAPNTSSMGSYAPFDISKHQNNQINAYHKKLEFALKSEKADFIGPIYSVFISTNSRLYNLEYNMRLGIPDGAVLLNHLENDIVDLYECLLEQRLDNFNYIYKHGKTCILNLASRQYPFGKLPSLELCKNTLEVFKKNNMKIFTHNVNLSENGIKKDNCGLFFGILHNSNEPFSEIYNVLESANIKDVFYRKDLM